MSDGAGPPKRRRRRGISPITRRILAVNLVAPALLAGGLFYFDDYRRNLIAAELAVVQVQAEMIAGALGERAIEVTDSGDVRLDFGDAQDLIRRMVEPTGGRARLFARDGNLMADSRVIGPFRRGVQAEPLPPPAEAVGLHEKALSLLREFTEALSSEEELEPYREPAKQTAQDFGEVWEVMNQLEATATQVRRRQDGAMVLSVAVPVQHYKKMLGVLMLSWSTFDVDRVLWEVRLNILELFGAALLVTTILSLYLAGTIARPLVRLAVAADRVRRSRRRRHTLPDLGTRSDEIGDLTLALQEMTQALWDRLDAIDRFAADVAHEIKNPLTSLRSAVETVQRVSDPTQRARLMAIIQDDVRRLDRLISDISEASRLDAELSRAETGPVDIGAMLAALVDVHAHTAAEGAPRLVLDRQAEAVVDGMEDRLVRVFRNLIGNAISFSPPDGSIRIVVAEGPAGTAEVRIEDQGPGIPPGKEEAIFERFYSERPKGEKFGTHSGLGLSISRQIVGAHGGTVFAENRPEGGARFVVRLPLR